MSRTHYLRILMTLASLLALTGAAPSVARSFQDLGAQGSPGTAFTFQGRLTDGGVSAGGLYDFQFTLFDAVTAGAQVGPTLTREDVTVNGGTFTVLLDFGNVFHGVVLFLDIGVRPGTATSAFTMLTPRQALSATPYALALPGLYTQAGPASPSIVGGYEGNSVAANASGAVIAGGGSQDSLNQVTADYSVVGGGQGNLASGPYATIAGGVNNIAFGSGAVIGGGGHNGTGRWGNQALANAATISGGMGNTIPAFGNYSVIGGGIDNVVSGWNATVAGGYTNTVSSSYGSIGGGQANVVAGEYGTVPGGYDNTATGHYSFAAGRRANANVAGCFVWADSTDTVVNCNTANQWVAQSSGGVVFYTNPTLTTGVQVAAGGGSWSSASDRSLKTNFAAVNPSLVLEKVAGLSIETWNYASQDPSIRHIGPVAQDFYTAFAVGEDNRHITAVDADGVALAAIQGLYQQNRQLAARITELEAASPAGAAAPPIGWLLFAGLALLNVGFLAGRRWPRRAGVA